MFGFDARTKALLGATARLGSLSAGAREIGMDPSNAHRHVRAAERRAGTKLVRRAGRGRAVVALRVAHDLRGVAGTFDAGEGTTPVTLGRRTLHVAGRVAPGPVAVAFRPEDVTLVRQAHPSSARNRVAGVVAAIHDAAEGTRLVLVAAGDVKIPALVTRGALRELRLKPGSRVVAVLKATAIHADAVAP